MQKIEFDVELAASDLYRFSMRHSYLSISGVFGLFLSVGSLIYLICNFSSLDKTACMALAIIGCLFTVVQPIMLYIKSKAQVQRNKNINAPLHYVISEEGITVCQGDEEGTVTWEEVQKSIVTSTALYLYMSPIRAFIFPKTQCGDLFLPTCKMVEEQMKKQNDCEE